MYPIDVTGILYSYVDGIPYSCVAVFFGISDNADIYSPMYLISASRCYAFAALSISFFSLATSSFYFNTVSNLRPSSS